MAELKLVPVDSIVPHPDNPRVQLREDVVSAIAANLDGEFPQKHALHVRAIGDDFQVLSGHHRLEAAKRAGLAAVWCWVEDLDDDAAFMELVMSNNQGELSPLEIGIHALKAVPLGKRGRGNKGGGMKEYAGKIGKDAGNVTRYRNAAEVADAVKKIVSIQSFIDRA